MMKDTIVLTDLRMAEAREAMGYLKAQGFRVAAVPEEICLWDEEALGGWASPLADRLLGVIHPALHEKYHIRGSLGAALEHGLPQ